MVIWPFLFPFPAPAIQYPHPPLVRNPQDGDSGDSWAETSHESPLPHSTKHHRASCRDTELPEDIYGNFGHPHSITPRTNPGTHTRRPSAQGTS